MAIRCCNCDYLMRTNQEIQSAVVKAGFDLKDWLFWIGTSYLMAGHLNTGGNAVVNVHPPYTGNGKRGNPWRRRVMAVCRYSQGEWPRRRQVSMTLANKAN